MSKPGDQVFTSVGIGGVASVRLSYVPADPVEYAICQRRGHRFDAWLGDERSTPCHWCGLVVRDERKELNPPKFGSAHPDTQAKPARRNE